ncbi:CshA/CshB family fibrillar adhesin-related protein [Gelidibacter sp.]|uniref:CshA/CshB family fibrillar adhesin-related protein n=1 Tax=Gelidibacter sp. TaxID=2018083 RepID=UPI002CD369B1|nr:CshA/CshB family fibrillar adhesin-related protein [Gelidibacter sp.]HUH27491.1 CshA/CshB family fibrillar adhesin-related protein [Gelidibacter sp.]
MYFKTKPIILGIAFVLLATFNKLQAQCYPDEIVTASFATGGSSPYIDDVLWLTWGSNSQTLFPHGRHNQPLSVGSKSRASIELGNNQWLCIEAEITAISGGNISSYAPGNYEGDYLDNLYNIGGTDGTNRLVSGIQNRTTGGNSTITIVCKATIDGVPIRLAGLVVADAESLAPTEYIYTTADGEWTLVEVKKNTALGAYNVQKEIVNVGGVPTSQRTMKFLRGNDKETMAVSFLKFNESAYNMTGSNPDLSVTVVATIKGSGLTAIALGLLPPDVDGGDAPESYGYPMHLIQRLNFSGDGIAPVRAGSTAVTNINTQAYQTGGLIPNDQLSHLGSTAPDTERIPLYSNDAMGDNNHGSAGTLEEDAWPDEHKEYSYKVYVPNSKINATIPYSSRSDGYIAGWIDFDRSGTFDPDEKIEVFAPSTGGNPGNVVMEWTVPPSRVAYGTFIRLRLSETPNISPTETVNTGEVEDHKLHILIPAVTNPMIHSRGKFKN